MSYLNSDMSWIIDELIHSERNRKVIKRRLIDGVLFEPLAEEFKLSVRQVKNIVYKAEKEIYQYIDNNFT